MASVSCPRGELEPLLEPWGGVSPGRDQRPRLRGPLRRPRGPRRAAGRLRAQKESAPSAIAVDYAAHSAQIEALKEELLDAFAPISPQSGEIPLHSTLTGEQIDTAELGPAYWYRNLRETVRLEPVIRSLLEQGQRTFIEICPHPVLALRPAGNASRSCRRPRAPRCSAPCAARRRARGALPSPSPAPTPQGAKLDWDAFFKGTRRQARPPAHLPLPARALLARLPKPARRTRRRSARATPSTPCSAPRSRTPPAEGLALTGRISLASHPWLADHAVVDTVLLPGTAFVELALQAAQRSAPSSSRSSPCRPR